MIFDALLKILFKLFQHYSVEYIGSKNASAENEGAWQVTQAAGIASPPGKHGKEAGIASPLSILKGKYGVYIIRASNTNEVLYIGKAGTIQQNGQCKRQDMYRRLLNVRNGISAINYYKDLIKKYGPIEITCIISSQCIAPAFLEAALLQAYLCDHSKLPAENTSF